MLILATVSTILGGRIVEGIEVATAKDVNESDTELEDALRLAKEGNRIWFWMKRTQLQLGTHSNIAFSGHRPPLTPG